MDHLADAFLFTECKRWDVKGEKLFRLPNKYYCEDIGLRNARIGFRQQEMTHIMENIIFNELMVRECAVDIGIVYSNERNAKGKLTPVAREIDFIAAVRRKKDLYPIRLRSWDGGTSLSRKTNRSPDGGLFSEDHRSGTTSGNVGTMTTASEYWSLGLPAGRYIGLSNGSSGSQEEAWYQSVIPASSTFYAARPSIPPHYLIPLGRRMPGHPGASGDQPDSWSRRGWNLMYIQIFFCVLVSLSGGAMPRA